MGIPPAPLSPVFLSGEERRRRRAEAKRREDPEPQFQAAKQAWKVIISGVQNAHVTPCEAERWEDPEPGLLAWWWILFFLTLGTWALFHPIPKRRRLTDEELSQRKLLAEAEEEVEAMLRGEVLP